jgi:pyruvyltransferase
MTDYFSKRQNLNRMRRRGNGGRFAHLSEGPQYQDIGNGQIRLFWWDGVGGRNFGDALSRYVVRAVTGKAVVRGEEGPKVVAVGSILRLATPGDIVWGSGLSRPSRVSHGLDIRAVRGPDTRRCVIEQGHKCPEVYGDPGLLIPRIWDTSGIEKDVEVGVLPHFTDADHAKALSPGAHFIDVLAGVPEVIREVARCKLIYSSSLHGIIAAEALGIPAVWVQYSDRIVGGTFKFKDYYASSRRAAPEPLDWRTSANPIAGREAPEIRTPDLNALIHACPGGSGGPLATKKLRRVRL